jgi:hypothetical protein
MESLRKEINFIVDKSVCYMIDPFDYDSILSAISDIYEQTQSPGIQYIVNLTAGTRIMTLGAFVAANLIGAEIHYIKEKDERIGENSDSQVIVIQSPKVPLQDLHEMHRTIIRTLYLLRNEKISQNSLRKKIEEISNEKGWKIKVPSVQLISHHCEFLEKNGFITRKNDETDKRSNVLSLTSIGKMAAVFIYAPENEKK